MVEQTTQLEIGRRYILIGRDSNLDVLYIGRTDSQPTEFPHQLITRHPANRKAVIRLRMREGGFEITGDRINPNSNLFTQIYDPTFPHHSENYQDIEKREGEEMLKQLEEARL